MSTSDDVWTALNAVNDQETFLFFVRELIEDRKHEVAREKVTPSMRYGPGVNGWENGSIESFLDAAAGWAEDTEFGQTGGPSLKKEDMWPRFAQFLYSGKVYE
jgi:predicted Ser/Thr protein kinase